MDMLKIGSYHLSIADKKLKYCVDEEYEVYEDCSALVKDFSPFQKLGCDITDDILSLVMDERVGAVFVRYPVTEYISGLSFISVKDVMKEGIEVDEEKKESTLTVEEQLEAANKQVENLKKQLELNKHYKEYRKAGDEIANLIRAFQDSGLSREEAVQFAMASLGLVI